MSQRNFYLICRTCGAPGHGDKQCPLRRLQEKQAALGPAKPRPYEVNEVLDSVQRATLDDSIKQLREKWGIKPKE